MKGYNMDGSIQVYYGNGRGKTTASLGLGIRAAGIGKKVIMIQFLKEKHSNTLEFLKKLEPGLKIFRFEKAADNYENLSPEEQQDQKVNIRNALNYTKKVMDTGQCDLLILDDILGLIDHRIMEIEELVRMLDMKRPAMNLILTGRNLPGEIAGKADCIYRITTEKEQPFDKILGR